MEVQEAKERGRSDDSALSFSVSQSCEDCKELF